MKQKQKRQYSYTSSKTNIFNKIYKVVAKIPKGKVTTYGEIGKFIGLSPRTVGWALHANNDPINIPCHRVVNRLGKLAPGYAFGGPGEQMFKLLKEGVEVGDDAVDLKKYLWSVKDNFRC